MFTRHMGLADLKLLFPDTLGKYSEAELINLSMDSVMLPCLEQVGFDTRKPIVYVPNKYRTLDKKVIVGFRACGTITTNRAFLNSKMASAVDRILAASTYDMSLAKEMCAMIGSNIQLRDDDALEEPDEFPKNQQEPDFHEVLSEMSRLINLRDKLRGPLHNKYGELKTMEEYQEELVSG